MILIGQYDSPFVRRVAIALRLYDLAFDHRPWSAFSDREKLAALNPLIRVPVLVLDDGTVLTDSHMMLDYLDSLVPAPLFPRIEPARHQALRVAALAAGVAEKAVTLFYEQCLHDLPSPVYQDRLQAQITGALAAIEAECARCPGPYWFGDSFGHADIMLACALRFVAEAHQGRIQPTVYTSLTALAARMESLPVFQEIRQAFIPPA